MLIFTGGRGEEGGADEPADENEGGGAAAKEEWWEGLAVSESGVVGGEGKGDGGSSKTR